MGGRLRTHPYRLLFPWGLMLSAAGVIPWTLVGLRVRNDYPAAPHAMTMVQAFLLCMAAGFLMTMLPRRTGTPPPRLASVWLLAVATGGIAFFSFAGRLVLAQAAWLIALGTLTTFVVRRLRPSGTFAPDARKPAVAFVWLEIALVYAWGGSLGAAVGGAWADMHWHWHQFGRMLILQGFFLALVLGAGSLAVPLMTGNPIDDSRVVPRGAHVGLAMLLTASFWLEGIGSIQWAYAIRALIIGVVLVGSLRAHRPPRRPGAARWMIWIGPWMIVLGFFLVAVLGDAQRSILHVVYIGGMGTLALGVAVQVSMGHANRETERDRSPRFLRIAILSLGLALAARLCLGFFPGSFHHLVTQASLFLIGASTLIAIGLWPSLRVKR